MNNKRNWHLFIIVFLALAIVAVNGANNIPAYAAVKKPGQVKGLRAPVKERYVHEIIPFSDMGKDNPTVLNVEREVWLYWKATKGADGYKIYVSKKGPNKGFKVNRSLRAYSNRGTIDCPIFYKGFKNTEVWVKVRAYKKSGKKTILGKASKTIKITLLYDPVVKSIEPNEDHTGIVIKWKPVYKATKYEVRIAKYSDMIDWTDEYNRNKKDSDYELAYDTPKALFAVAKLVATTSNTECTIIPEEMDCHYSIHIRALRGKAKSSDYGWYDYYCD